MKPAFRRLAAPALILAFALGASLLGCSSGSDEGTVESTFDIRLTTGTAMRGVSLTLMKASDFSVVSIEPADDPIGSGSCSENVTLNEIRATCATTTTSFSAPIDAWRITLSHQSDRDLDQGVLNVVCEASDATGTTFAIGCQVVQ